MYLESFLLTEDIPYRKVGVCLNKHALLPVPMFIEGNGALLPSGIYFVYPDTDQEIIYYFYMEFREDQRDAPRYILCYRKEDVFKNLTARYHEFCAAKKKEENFLDDCKDYCHRHIISKLRLSHLLDTEPEAPEKSIT